MHLWGCFKLLGLCVLFRLSWASKRSLNAVNYGHEVTFTEKKSAFSGTDQISPVFQTNNRNQFKPANKQLHGGLHQSQNERRGEFKNFPGRRPTQEQFHILHDRDKNHNNFKFNRNNQFRPEGQRFRNNRPNFERIQENRNRFNHEKPILHAQEQFERRPHISIFGQPNNDRYGHRSPNGNKQKPLYSPNQKLQFGPESESQLQLGLRPQREFQNQAKFQNHPQPQINVFGQQRFQQQKQNGEENFLPNPYIQQVRIQPTQQPHNSNPQTPGYNFQTNSENNRGSQIQNIKQIKHTHKPNQSSGTPNPQNGIPKQHGTSHETVQQATSEKSLNRHHGVQQDHQQNGYEEAGDTGYTSHGPEFGRGKLSNTPQANKGNQPGFDLQNDRNTQNEDHIVLYNNHNRYKHDINSKGSHVQNDQTIRPYPNNLNEPKDAFTDETEITSEVLLDTDVLEFRHPSHSSASDGQAKPQIKEQFNVETSTINDFKHHNKPQAHGNNQINPNYRINQDQKRPNSNTRVIPFRKNTNQFINQENQPFIVPAADLFKWVPVLRSNVRQPPGGYRTNGFPQDRNQRSQFRSSNRVPAFPQNEQQRNSLNTHFEEAGQQQGILKENNYVKFDHEYNGVNTNTEGHQSGNRPFQKNTQGKGPNNGNKQRPVFSAERYPSSSQNFQRETYGNSQYLQKSQFDQNEYSRTPVSTDGLGLSSNRRPSKTNDNQVFGGYNIRRKNNPLPFTVFSSQNQNGHTGGNKSPFTENEGNFQEYREPIQEARANQNRPVNGNYQYQYLENGDSPSLAYEQKPRGDKNNLEPNPGSFSQNEYQHIPQNDFHVEHIDGIHQDVHNAERDSNRGNYENGVNNELQSVQDTVTNSQSKARGVLDSNQNQYIPQNDYRANSDGTFQEQGEINQADANEQGNNMHHHQNNGAHRTPEQGQKIQLAPEKHDQVYAYEAENVEQFQTNSKLNNEGKNYESNGNHDALRVQPLGDGADSFTGSCSSRHQHKLAQNARPNHNQANKYGVSQYHDEHDSSHNQFPITDNVNVPQENRHIQNLESIPSMQYRDDMSQVQQNQGPQPDRHAQVNQNLESVHNFQDLDSNGHQQNGQREENYEAENAEETVQKQIQKKPNVPSEHNSPMYENEDRDAEKLDVENLQYDQFELLEDAQENYQGLKPTLKISKRESQFTSFQPDADEAKGLNDDPHKFSGLTEEVDTSDNSSKIEENKDIVLNYDSYSESEMSNGQFSVLESKTIRINPNQKYFILYKPLDFSSDEIHPAAEQ